MANDANDSIGSDDHFKRFNWGPLQYDDWTKPTRASIAKEWDMQAETAAMAADEHQRLAYRTAPKTYLSATHQQMELIHAVLGLASELGEIAGTVKKHIIYNQPLDVANLVEEVGDSDWYAALLLSALNEFRSIAMEQNIDKLRKRYPDGYSDLAATQRADKAETGVAPLNICSTCGQLLQRALYTHNTMVCSTLTCESFYKTANGEDARKQELNSVLAAPVWRKADCPTCNGAGAHISKSDPNRMEHCFDCGGSGLLEDSVQVQL